MDKKEQPGCSKAIISVLPFIGILVVIQLFIIGASEAGLALPLKGFEFLIIGIIILAIKFSNDKKEG